MRTLDAPFGLCATTPTRNAQPVLEKLQERDLLDSTRAVANQEGRLLIPVHAPEKARALVDSPLIEAQTGWNPRREPLDRVRDRLRGTIPDRVLGLLPEGWTRLGDVLLLRLPRELEPYESRIAAAYARELDARSVLTLEGTRGPLREPTTRHLWGDPNTETTHTENGLTYHLDPGTILFSAGNHHERHRLASTIEPGEHVVDLFAGIGYFTLPLARAGAHVTACELNPEAARFLHKNVAANHLKTRVTIREGDARNQAPRHEADRVLMGYFPGTQAFLPTASATLKPDGGWIHYHSTQPSDTATQSAIHELTHHDALHDAHVRIANARHVKTVAPRKTHVVLDAEVTR